MNELVEKVKATRTAWLQQHGVPISQEFVDFAVAIGDLCDFAERAAQPQSQQLPQRSEREIIREVANKLCSCCSIDGDPILANFDDAEWTHHYPDGSTITCECQDIWDMISAAQSQQPADKHAAWRKLNAELEAELYINCSFPSEFERHNWWMNKAIRLQETLDAAQSQQPSQSDEKFPQEYRTKIGRNLGDCIQSHIEDTGEFPSVGEYQEMCGYVEQNTTFRPIPSSPTPTEGK